jgi:hypothetical protein
MRKKDPTKYSKDRLQFWAGKLHGDDGLTDLFEVERGRIGPTSQEFLLLFMKETGWGSRKGFSAAEASARFGDWKQKKSNFRWKRWHSTAFNHLLNELTFVGVFDRVWVGDHFVYSLAQVVKKNGLSWIESSSFILGGGFGFEAGEDE